jgi:signal transduction histidine kinase/DNA repair protein RadC
MVSISFSTIFIHHQSKRLANTMIQKGTSIAELSSFNSRLGVLSNNPDLLDNVADGVMGQEGVLSFDVYTLNGEIIFQKGRKHEIDNLKLQTVINEITQSNSSKYLVEDDHYEFWSPVLAVIQSSEESLFFSTESTGSGYKLIGFVKIDISNAGIIISRKSLLIKAIAICILFTFIGTLIALLVTKGITIPLRQLSSAVRSFGKGNIPNEIPVGSVDEVGDLASAFNEMTKMLHQRENEKNRLLEQLNESQKLEAIGTLASGISHDFNNILSIIQINIELAESKAPEYIKEYLQRSLKASERGKGLVDRILDFTHEGSFIATDVNIDLLARETIGLLKENTSPAIDVDLDIEAELWLVKGDAGQLQQVIMNLFTNAHDAIIENPVKLNESPKINIVLKNVSNNDKHLYNISPEKTGEFIALSVIDNGPGIDLLTRKHVFEPFFTTKHSSGGKGLGLSSVYGIVKHHGGTIDIQSESGKGAAFSVYLPRSTQAISNNKTVPDKVHQVAGTETILIVDDEEHIAAPLREKLEDLEYKVLSANTAKSAIEILEKNDIHLIVLDYILPDISGIEVYKHIKNNKIDTKVIMHSGRDLKQFSDLLENVKVIRKPSNLNALCQEIREELGYNYEHSLKTSISRIKYYFLDEKTIPYKHQIGDITTAYKLFRHIAYEPQEKFITLYLASDNKIIAYDELSTGTIDRSIVYPREIIKGAVLTNAMSIMLLHNHPSGDLSPSQNDIIITAAILQSCRIMDINVLDHLIIGKEDFYSFSQNGDL